MKIIFYLMMLTTTLTLGQININHEHTYTHSGSVGDQNNNIGFTKPFITDQGLFYYSQEYDQGDKITIYDQYHTFYKTFTIIGNNYGGTVYFVTDKLFNNDDLIEFVYVEKKQYGFDTKLINENGVQLFIWSDRWLPKIFKDNDNNFKIAVYNQILSSPYTVQTDIYALEGTLSIEQQDSYLDKSFRGYPNPSEDKITITNFKFLVEDTKIEVFNSNGQKVFEKKIRSGENEIILDTQGFSSGTYIYKINGETNKFIKK